MLTNDLEILRFIPSSPLEPHTARFFSSKGLFAYILVKIYALLIKEPENKDRGTGIWYINKRKGSNSLLGQMSLQDNIAELTEKKSVLIPPASYSLSHGLEQVSRKQQRHICVSCKTRGNGFSLPWG